MKRIFKFIKRLFIFVLVILLITFSFVTFEGYKLYKDKTNEISIEEKVKKIRAEEDYVTYNDIPEDFVNALVSIEDRRYFKHNGIDVISICRAVITDLREKSLVEGGSTITQQLAKNIYFSREKKFSRKVAEVFVAFNLEKNYSKEDILELYINIVYFGDGHYGIKQASLGYFNKLPKDLTLSEITMLAGLPNAPSAYALSNKTELSTERQDMVIDAMVKNNYLSEEDAKRIKENN